MSDVDSVLSLLFGKRRRVKKRSAKKSSFGKKKRKFGRKSTKGPVNSRLILNLLSQTKIF